MVGDSDLDKIKRHFGVYGSDTKKFDTSVQTLLNLPLPEAAVREIVGGIWSEAWDAGYSEGIEQ